MRTISFLPYGMKGRRAWFFYELLTGRSLDMPDATGGNAIDALDATAYFTAKPRLSRRHRVRDNLLGTAQADWESATTRRSVFLRARGERAALSIVTIPGRQKKSFLKFHQLDGFRRSTVEQRTICSRLLTR